MTLASTTDISAGFADSWLRDVLAAVHGVLGLPRSPLPLHEPEFAGREWQYVKECLDTGWVSSAGAYVDRFERDLCSYTGAAHAIATSNGTSALHTCLLLAGVRAGDEVLTPTLHRRRASLRRFRARVTWS